MADNANVLDGDDEWSFPKKKEYHSSIRDLMGFIHGCKYPGSTIQFTKEQLLAIKLRHIRDFLSIKVYGTAAPGPTDRPTKGRANSLEYHKKAISFYMPNAHPWVSVAGQPGHGNPTKSKQVNDLIADVRKAEVKQQGKATQACRDMTMLEFHKQLDLFRAKTDKEIGIETH